MLFFEKGESRIVEAEQAHTPKPAPCAFNFGARGTIRLSLQQKADQEQTPETRGFRSVVRCTTCEMLLVRLSKKAMGKEWRWL